MHPAVDLGALAPTLGTTCQGYLSGYRDAYRQAVQQGAPGVATARRFSRAQDGLLGALFCAADAVARSVGQPPQPQLQPQGRVALVAVGGYGRGIVGLESDVDVLFLCDQVDDAYVHALSEGVLYPLWDLGVEIGHVVRGVEETLALAREDIRTSTTLLDLRWVAGDRAIVEDLRSAARRRVFEPGLEDFLTALREDTDTRHQRFGGSLYLLEPEVKKGRGGLRDLDVAEWTMRARWAVRDPEDYVRKGVLVRQEKNELEAAREMLWKVRNLLHLRAGRPQDRLTFADQEEIAITLGFVDGITLGVEQFMQAYYRHARLITSMADRVLDRARISRRRRPEKTRDLGDGTQTFGNMVTLERTERLSEDPALAFRFYHQVTKRALAPYSFAREAIARVSVDRSWQQRLRSSEEATQLFLQMIKFAGDAPVRYGSLLGEIHEVGLLTAMIPEFAPLTGRVQHDVYHVYTVDVHAILSVDRLHALVRGERFKALGLAARLAAEAPRRTPLYCALLLHSLGWARGRKSTAESAKLAGPILTRLGLSDVDKTHIVWLIEHAWRLYHEATQRDIYAPEVITEVARLAGNRARLDDLYLITVCVLSTINPTAMTSWKARMLEDLYLSVANHLEGHNNPTDNPTDKCADRQTRVHAIRGDVLSYATQHSTTHPNLSHPSNTAFLTAFLDEMPERYLLAHPTEEIHRHAAVMQRLFNQPIGVTLHTHVHEDLHELIVFAQDRPGLLADVAAVLAGHQLEIISAEIYTRRQQQQQHKDQQQQQQQHKDQQQHTDEQAFDIFLVRRKHSSHNALPASLEQALITDLASRIADRVSVQDLLTRHSRPTYLQHYQPSVETAVTVDNEASPHFTIIDISTRDRTGLLHVIARTLHQERVSIAISKVNTEGSAVADVFYVEDADAEKGGKLHDPERLASLQKALLHAIQRFHANAEERA